MPLPRFQLTERQVLMSLMGITVLAVLGSFFWSTLFTSQVKRMEAGNARVHWMRTPTAGTRFDARYLVAEYSDPSVMALPNPRGFSHAAWSHLSPPAEGIYEPERRPEFLPAPSGFTMPDLLKQPPLNAVVLGGLLAPQPADDLDGEQPAPAPVLPATNSVIQIGGGLSHRHVVRQPNIPLAPAGVPVHIARVLVAVTMDGQVRYAVLDRSSGNEPLDNQAVVLAERLQFDMAPSTDPLALTWGTVHFLWSSAPVP